MQTSLSQTLSRPAVCAALLLSVLAAPGNSQASGPSIDRASLLVGTTTRGIYYAKPDQPDDERSSWLPHLGFRLNGPIESGTYLQVQYSVQGKPWVSYGLQPEPRPVGVGYRFEREGGLLPDEKGTIAEGPVGLTIRAVNELSGLNAVLYQGSFNVKKFHAYDPQKFPAMKNKFNYYVDQDWRLPFGFLTGDWYGSDKELNTTPHLHLKLWFRGERSSFGDTQAHLFYQNKPIAKAEGLPTRDVMAPDSAINSWTEYTFPFKSANGLQPVIYWDTSGNDAAHAHLFNLYSHPGDYELKVLHKGALSRSLKFQVGSDGRIVDNGYSLRLGLFDSWTLPVKTVKQTDGAWDLNAWKTGAFYGNPLPGFVLP